MEYPTNPLSLTGIVYGGQVGHFDGTNIDKGVGLRWNFDPLLGYPEKGFSLYLIGFEGSTLVTSNKIYEWLPDMKLNDIFALHTIFETEKSTLPPYYLKHAVSLNESVINFHKQCVNEPERSPATFRIGEETKDDVATLRVVDSLLIAAIDPILARIVGLLYHHSPTTNSSQTSDWAYRVEGDWGDRQHPCTQVKISDFNLSSGFGQEPANDRVNGAERPIINYNSLVNDKLLLTAPPISVQEQPDSETYLATVIGVVSISWKQPIEGFKIKAKKGSKINITSIDGRQVDRYIEPTEDDSLVYDQPAVPFSTIQLQVTEPLIIDEIIFWEKKGPIGKLQAWWFLSSVLEELAKVSLLSTAPPLLKIYNSFNGLCNVGELTSEASPLLLDEAGKVSVPSSQVALSAYSYPALGRGFADPSQPVRFIFKRQATTSNQSASKPLVLNGNSRLADESPAIRYYSEEILPDLIAWYPLTGNLVNSKTNKAATALGNPRFVKVPADFFWQSPVLVDKGVEQRPLPDQSLLLEANKYISLGEVLNHTVIQNGFTLLLSLHPTPDSFSIPFQTILFNSAEPSRFWLQLRQKQSESTALPEYTIILAIHNQKAVETTFSIRCFKWSYLAISYKGNLLTIDEHTANYAQRIHRFSATLQVTEDQQVWNSPPSFMLGGTTQNYQGFRGAVNNLIVHHSRIGARKLWEQVVPTESYLHLSAPVTPVARVAGIFSTSNPTIGYPIPGIETEFLPVFSVQFQLRIASLETTDSLLVQFGASTFLYLTPAGQIGFKTSATDHPGQPTFVFNGISNTALAVNKWTEVAVTYDGIQVKIFINGQLAGNLFTRNVETAQRFQLYVAGPIKASGKTDSFVTLKGQMADFSLWRVPKPPRRFSIKGPQLQAEKEFIFSSGRPNYQFNASAIAPRIDAQGAISGWMKLDESPNNYVSALTILHGYSESNLILDLTLVKIGKLPGYALTIPVLGFQESFDKPIPSANLAIQPNTWTHVCISFGVSIQNPGYSWLAVFVNGRLYHYDVKLGHDIILDKIEIGFLNLAPNAQLLHLKDFQVWNEPISPTELQSFTSPYYLTDRKNLTDGDYRYQVQGIDIFGRLSDWSVPVQVNVTNSWTNAAPVDVKPEFVPLWGKIDKISEPPQPDPVKEPSRWIVQVTLTPGIQVEWTKLVQYPIWLIHPCPTREKKQQYTILKVHVVDAEANKVAFELNSPSFAQVQPATEMPVLIEYDYNLKICWAWTGLQQLYSPELTGFDIYLKKGVATPQFSGKITAVQDKDGFGTYEVETTLEIPPVELLKQFCNIDQRLYEIQSYQGSTLTIEHKVKPPTTPAVGSEITIRIPETSTRYSDPLAESTWSNPFPYEPEAFPKTDIPENTEIRYSKISAEAVKTTLKSRILETTEPSSWYERGLDWLPESKLLKFTIPVSHLNDRNDWVRYTKLPSEVILPEDHPDKQKLQAKTALIETDRLRQNYIPSALVLYVNEHESGEASTWQWKAYYVLWHYVKDDALYCYTLYPEGLKAEDLPLIGQKPGFPAAYVYWGQSFQLGNINVSNWNLDTDFTKQSTDNFLLAIKAKGKWPGQLSKPVSLIATDRKIPLKGPVPTVSFVKETKRDEVGNPTPVYFQPRPNGTIDATITWQNENNDLHQLYRATDTAIFERDLYQRRTRPADSAYEGQNARRVFQDDEDFSDWLRAFRNRSKANLPDELAARWEYFQSYTDEQAFLTKVLFASELPGNWETIQTFWKDWAEKYNPNADLLQQNADIKAQLHEGMKNLRKDSQSNEAYLESILAKVPDWRSLAQANPASYYFQETNPDWITASHIWRAWADRFYPALSPDDIANIANRKGNEAAFTLVNSSPINGTSYTDEVNGRISNYYVYRTRVYGANGNTGAWSDASIPKKVPIPASPPRKPVFTKVEAGDRQITLQWALNREPDLLGYYLYRAERPDELNDLRWIHAIPRPTVHVQFIPDPRIVIKSEGLKNYIVFPATGSTINEAAIVGLFNWEELDLDSDLASMIGNTPNYWLQGANSNPPVPEAIEGTLFRRFEVSKNATPGNEMVVIWKDKAGNLQTLTQFDWFPFVDQSHLTNSTYHYKIEAICLLHTEFDGKPKRIRSVGSETVTGRMIFEPVLLPPEWKSPVIHSYQQVELSWKLSEINLRTLVQRKLVFDDEWENISDWLGHGIAGFTDINRENFQKYIYRLVVMDTSGTLNKQFNEIEI